MPKVLHLCRTPMAGSPGMISRIVDAYTDWDSKIFCQRTKISAGDFSIDYKDMVKQEDLFKEVSKANLLHFHNSGPDQWKHVPVSGKPFIVQLHSEPKVMNNILQKYRMHCYTLAQKHAVLYGNLPYFPNMIPIMENKYKPAHKEEGRVNIVYAPTSKVELTDYKVTCMGKGYNNTIKILQALQQRFGRKLHVEIYNQTPKEMVLRAKRKADIVIDEVVTGGYHLSSLEAMSMGCVPVSYLQPEVSKIICNIANCSTSDLPWVNTHINKLGEELARLIELKLTDKNKFKEYSKRSRRWMKEHWHPEKLSKRYFEKAYNKFSNNTQENTDSPWAGLVLSRDINKVRQMRNKVYSVYDYNQKANEANISWFKDKHKGRSAFIMGNGPSVKRIDVDGFVRKNNPIVFNCNYYFKGDIKIKPNYWACIDTNVFFEVVKKYLLEDIIVIANPPTRFLQFRHSRLWISRAKEEFDKFFNHEYELERPCTVATIMTLYAMYMGCNPINIIGVDLSLDKTSNNYFYSGQGKNEVYNSRFRDFSRNINFILKEFWYMKEDAKEKGIGIFNLDPNPTNFKTFELPKEGSLV